MKLSNQTVIVAMCLITISLLTAIGTFIYLVTRNESKNPKNDRP
jgi:hypothetical protein